LRYTITKPALAVQNILDFASVVAGV